MKYVTHFDVDDGGVVAPVLSTSRGVSVTGDRMHAGLVLKARGTRQASSYRSNAHDV